MKRKISMLLSLAIIFMVLGKAFPMFETEKTAKASVKTYTEPVGITARYVFKNEKIKAVKVSNKKIATATKDGQQIVKIKTKKKGKVMVTVKAVSGTFRFKVKVK